MKRLLATAAIASLALVILSDGLAHAGITTNPQEISGFVLDASNNKPAHNTCVTISPGGGNPDQTATVQTDGSYLLTNVPVGSWMTYAWDCRKSPKYAPVTFRNVAGLESDAPPAEFVTSLPDGSNVEVNFTINKGGTIAVKATNPAGKGIPGAVVCPYFAATNVNGHLVGSGKCATANAKGVATIKGVQPGSSKLQIIANGYLPLWYGGTDFASATSVNVVAGKTTKLGDVDVDVDPAGTGTISGRITGPGGAPIAGACATVWTNTATFSAGTNPDGSYTVPGVPGGFWEVTGEDCSDPVEYAPTVYKNHQGSLDAEVADNVLVVDGAAVSGIDMKLARSGTIEVHVIDSGTSSPIDGAGVCPYWWQPNPFGHQFQSDFCGGTGTDGTVRLTGVRVGKNKVFATAPDYFLKYFGGGSDFASAATVNVTVGGVTVITIALDPIPPP
jgi:hypothetical protein